SAIWRKGSTAAPCSGFGRSAVVLIGPLPSARGDASVSRTREVGPGGPSPVNHRSNATGGRNRQGVCYYPRRRNSPPTSGSSRMTSTDLEPGLDLDLGKYKLGWSDEEDYVFKPKRGLREDVIQEMSWMKGEPNWMRNYRLKSYEHFLKRPMPNWGG